MYSVEYINCRVCGSDSPRFLGIRGNREYAGAPRGANKQEHMTTNVVRCKKCGFVYTNPLIKAGVDVYNDPIDYEPSSSKGANVLFNFILDQIEKHAERGRMLDIGCGKGEFLSLAQSRGWKGYGIEPSENFAKFASQSYGINIGSAPLEEAKYPSNFFDVITLNMVLEHVDNPRQLLNNVRGLLKSGGALFIEVPNTDSLMLKVSTWYFKLKGRGWSTLLSPLHRPFHSYGYNRASLKFLLIEQQFQVQKLVVCDGGLRGFRPDSGGSGFEKFFRDFTSGLGGLIGAGDILMAIGRKR